MALVRWRPNNAFMRNRILTAPRTWASNRGLYVTLRKVTLPSRLVGEAVKFRLVLRRERERTNVTRGKLGLWQSEGRAYLLTIASQGYVVGYVCILSVRIVFHSNLERF